MNSDHEQVQECESGRGRGRVRNLWKRQRSGQGLKGGPAASCSLGAASCDSSSVFQFVFHMQKEDDNMIKEGKVRVDQGNNCEDFNPSNNENNSPDCNTQLQLYLENNQSDPDQTGSERGNVTAEQPNSQSILMQNKEDEGTKKPKLCMQDMQHMEKQDEGGVDRNRRTNQSKLGMQDMQHIEKQDEGGEDRDISTNKPKLSMQHMQQIEKLDEDGENEDKPTKRPKLSGDEFVPKNGVQCPRCNSDDTKFCYFNNRDEKQPRYFCRGCQRYWTKGGNLRNVPPGSGRRKTKKQSTSQSTQEMENHHHTFNNFNFQLNQNYDQLLIPNTFPNSSAASHPLLNPFLGAQQLLPQLMNASSNLKKLNGNINGHISNNKQQYQNGNMNGYANNYGQNFQNGNIAPPTVESQLKLLLMSTQINSQQMAQKINSQQMAQQMDSLLAAFVPYQQQLQQHQQCLFKKPLNGNKECDKLNEFSSSADRVPPAAALQMLLKAQLQQQLQLMQQQLLPSLWIAAAQQQQQQQQQSQLQQQFYKDGQIPNGNVLNRGLLNGQLAENLLLKSMMRQLPLNLLNAGHFQSAQAGGMNQQPTKGSYQNGNAFGLPVLPTNGNYQSQQLSALYLQNQKKVQTMNGCPPP